QIDPSCPGVLGEEQRCDEVSAQDKEQVDAQVAPREPVLVEVIDKNSEDRDRAEAVEEWTIAVRRVLWCGPCRGHGSRRIYRPRSSCLGWELHGRDYAGEAPELHVMLSRTR